MSNMLLLIIQTIVSSRLCPLCLCLWVRTSMFIGFFICFVCVCVCVVSMHHGECVCGVCFCVCVCMYVCVVYVCYLYGSDMRVLLISVWKSVHLKPDNDILQPTPNIYVLRKIYNISKFQLLY